MKLISLNTWGGLAGKEGLLSFIEKYKDTDVICLQEAWQGGEEMHAKLAAGRQLIGLHNSMLNDMKVLLPEHSLYFHPQVKDYFGLATFVKKSIQVQQVGEVFVHKERGYLNSTEWADHSRNVQYITIATEKGPRTILNFHGLWNGKGKTDSEERLLQSDNIIKMVKNFNHPIVLCGDFNLRPDTVSLRKFEDAGMKNLIAQFGVTNTRSSLYTKEERFADYVFVSPEIKVSEFKMLPDEVSDHLAMYLDFE